MELLRLAYMDQFIPSHAEGGYLDQGGFLPARTKRAWLWSPQCLLKDEISIDH